MADQVALVTGGTSGIGWATCELLAKKKINLLVTGRNKEQLEKLKSHLSSLVSIETYSTDLSQTHGRQEVISILHDYIPNIVINNAGFGLYGDALTYSTNDQVDILEVNARAVLEITLEAARALVSAGKKGVILNVSSAAAFQVFPTMAVYAASKAFVNHFSQAFDFEVKKFGIRILTLCPGMVATDFQKRAGGLRYNQRGTMSATYVAERIWHQIETESRLSIIDWKYKLLTYFSFLFPTRWIASAEECIISKRINPRTIVKIKQ